MISKLPEHNYRPVFLDICDRKFFERLLKRAICVHLESNDLLSPDQHRFRKGRSFTSNLEQFMEIVTSTTDERCDIIYFDFSKVPTTHGKVNCVTGSISLVELYENHIIQNKPVELLVLRR